MDCFKAFASFILTHVAKILSFTNDGFEMAIVLKVAEWLNPTEA